MRVTQLTIGIKRDVRHAPYNVSQCQYALTAKLAPEDNLADVWKEIYDDVIIMVEDGVENEKEKYKKEKMKNATKSK